MGGSEKTLKNFLSFFSKTIVGSDKVNQARHINFLKDTNALKKHMEKLGTLIKPKFDIVESYLAKLPEGIADWSRPTGGYFVSFNAKPGKASKIYKLCFEAGLKLTPVGATFPYGIDPDNQNLRLSPTQVKNSDLKKSMEIFTLAVLLLSLIHISEPTRPY